MLIVMRGLPASGKSTWAASRVAEDPHGTAVVSRDHYRMMLHATNRPVDGIMEDDITELEADAVVRLLARGRTVIVDDTNLPHRRVREWLGLAEASGASWQVEDLTGVPLGTCLQRNRDRDRQVPEEIITGWHARYIAGGRARPPAWEPIPGGFTDQEVGAPYTPVPGTPAAVLVDIDGTVADRFSADGAELRGPYDWSRVSLDRPRAAIVDHVRMAAEHMKVIFLSGRPETCRADTLAWLDEHVGVPIEGLYMRPAERPQDRDSVVKLALFDEHIRTRYTVHSVLDDRAHVVAMWRRLGLTVLQVAPGMI